MIGQDISALANSAALYDKQTAYMIWGVDDNSHEIIGTELIKPLDPDTAPRYM